MVSRTADAVLAIGITALSFGTTLFMLNHWFEDPTSESLFTSSITRSDNSTETALNELPKPTGFDWYAARGLNIVETGELPAVPGQTVLRLIAIPNHTVHSLVAQYNDLYANRVYRVTAWVKPKAATNVELFVHDEPNGTPRNMGLAIFDLTSKTIVTSTGLKAQGIEPGADKWQKVWVDQATTGGQFLVSVRPARGATDDFDGDGRLDLILGGIEVAPQTEYASVRPAFAR
jgi:hypothetical protein